MNREQWSEEVLTLLRDIKNDHQADTYTRERCAHLLVVHYRLSREEVNQ